MSGVIQATYGASQQLIKNIAGGDQWLPDWIEPMNMVPNNGAAITLTSRKKQHLTFGMVGSAMQVRYFLSRGDIYIGLLFSMLATGSLSRAKDAVLETWEMNEDSENTADVS